MDGMGKKIAIFGGSFDPVHLGHVALVVALKEACSLDSVLIIPANVSPHKTKVVPQEAKHRLYMLKKAFKDLSYCKVLPIEVQRTGPSYTVDTVLELKTNGMVKKEDALYLILGQDQLAGFSSWKHVERLMQEVVPLVASRTAHATADDGAKIHQWLKDGMIETPNFEISSTNIRKRIHKKLYCGHLLNNLVYNYIQRTKLYE